MPAESDAFASSFIFSAPSSRSDGVASDARRSSSSDGVSVFLLWMSFSTCVAKSSPSELTAVVASVVSSASAAAAASAAASALGAISSTH